jgi:hypothetical protein
MEFIKELMKLRESDTEEVKASDLTVDDQVHNQLDNAAKDDSVDAQCFGLEMEDGKVVKVYVKQEDAEEFEKALSARLGEDDDVQTALEELGKDFEIVEIVWPDGVDEEGNEESDDEDDEDSDDDNEDTDGSESMNDDVDYSDTKPKKESTETLSLGQRFTKKLTELKWSDDEHKAYKDAAAAHGDDSEASDEGQTDDPATTPSKTESKWKVEKDEEGCVSISNDRFSMELDEDESNDLINKISDKQVARFKNEQGKIVYVFTPRGSEYILKTPEFQGGFRIPQKVLDQITAGTED